MLGQLRKALAFANDQGFTTGLYVRVSVEPVVASTFSQEALMPTVVFDLKVIETIILVTAPEVG